MAAITMAYAIPRFFRMSWIRTKLGQKGTEMKRIFSLLIVLCLLLVFIGCVSPANSLTNTASQDSGELIQQPTASVPAVDLGVAVKTFDELVAALNDTTVTKAHISTDLDIAPAQEATFEREGFVLTIDEGVTVTIRDNFIPVFFGTENAPGLVVNGTLKIAGTFNFGAMTLQNNGTLEVLDGGTLCPGMSKIVNDGTMQIDKGGVVRLERGTGLQNNATLLNLGELNITSDGGSLISTATGSLTNNGTITFEGDYQNEGTYTGAQQEP